MDEALNSYFPVCSVRRTQTYLTRDEIHDLEKPGKNFKKEEIWKYIHLINVPNSFYSKHLLKSMDLRDKFSLPFYNSIRPNDIHRRDLKKPNIHQEHKTAAEHSWRSYGTSKIRAVWR